MNIFKRKETIILLRLVVGVTFLYASFDKVSHPAQFAIAVRSYQILPVNITNLFALILSWAELISGVLLILGLFTRQAAGAILMMLFMFVVALSIVMIKGMVIDCGCFTSEGGASVNFLLLVRNILMSVVCILIMKFDRGLLSLSRLIPTRS